MFLICDHKRFPVLQALAQFVLAFQFCHHFAGIGPAVRRCVALDPKPLLALFTFDFEQGNDPDNNRLQNDGGEAV